MRTLMGLVLFGLALAPLMLSVQLLNGGIRGQLVRARGLTPAQR